MALARFGVSLEEEVLRALDHFVIENSFPNRSRAIRHLIEKNLVEEKWQSNELVAGAVVLLYDHHKGDVTNKANHLQHHYADVILSSQHFHLSHDNCMEIIAVKGHAARLTELSDKLIGLKGVIHGQLIMSKTE
ncbi:MAG: nickel-responsive transcriptional regulator NikR [Bacteroidales bacterium]|nr:nickel-responsive transcriptional regulator NikR [Bacteroidales bacterium]